MKVEMTDSSIDSASVEAATNSISVVDVEIENRQLPYCPLCKNNRWNYPIKILECGHSFCLTCLKGIRRRLGKDPKWWIKCKRIKCPVCKIMTSTSWITLKQLPTNFDLQNLLDVVYASNKQPLKKEAPLSIDDTVSDIGVSCPSESSDSSSRISYTYTVWMGSFDGDEHIDLDESNLYTGPIPNRIFDNLDNVSTVTETSSWETVPTVSTASL